MKAEITRIEILLAVSFTTDTDIPVTKNKIAF